MIIIPAIDILDGGVVRLHRGDYTTAETYNTDPSSMAREFEKAGATRIHIVDLDGARDGGKHNRKKIRKVRKAFSGTIELGGGIRDEDDIAELLDLGIDRFVIGTVFAKNYRKVEGWVQHYGDIFIAGIDALDGQARISGWETGTETEDIVLARRAEEIGMCSIIYTNINKDGSMEGPDLDSTNKIAEAVSIPVIHSGGIRNLEDIENLVKAKAAGIEGVIVGKAIYEKTLSLPEAFSTYRNETTRHF